VLAEGIIRCCNTHLSKQVPFLNLSPRLSIHYLDINPGGSPTVLLLHGLGVNGSSWALQLPALEKAGFRVLAPDLRGFGKSTYPGGRLSAFILASDMAALLDLFHAGAAHVIGISMGGIIALQLAIEHPNLVDKLILVNTFARLRPQRLSVWVYYALRLFLVHTLGLPTQARVVSWRIFPRPEQAELRSTLYAQITQANPAGYRATMRALARFNALPRLNELCHPTLVITGERDTTVPAEVQNEMAARIPLARQVIIPDAGHAVIAEQPELFNHCILDFLLDKGNIP